ncbi:MAG: FGGY-family carbohydrate kinase, partial [Candidatus Humimicrobiaceae bacterium]
RATGGGSRSETWLQFKANILGKIIQKLDIDEAGCMSAAVLAGYGSKDFNSVAGIIDDWVKIKKEYEPDLEKFKNYEERYLKFISAYEKIKDININNTK